MAFCFEAIFGVVFGIISGLKKGKWYDSVILVCLAAAHLGPDLRHRLRHAVLPGVEWRILPVTAGANPGFLDLLMPAMVLGSVSMAYIIRLSRTEISSNKSETMCAPREPRA